MRLRTTATLAVSACLLIATASPPAASAQPSEHSFEIVPGSFHFAPTGTQAGEHADWVTSFDFAHEGDGATFNDVRDTLVNLPAGFVGSSTAVPTCTTAQLPAKGGRLGEGTAGPVASQVGEITLELSLEPGHSEVTRYPVYSMDVNRGEGVAAELGFKTVLFTVLLRIGVRPGDSGLSVSTPNIPTIGEPHGVSVTIWGLPASHVHDAERGLTCGGIFDPGRCSLELGGPQEAHIPVRPSLSNPASCGVFTASLEAYSWEESGNVQRASAQTPAITGCERVPFGPSIEARPTTRAAESPTGLDFSLLVPQTYENPDTIATANLRDTTVTLPAGMTINPSAGSGLGACSPGRYAAETATSLPGAGCPPESKIGSIDIETPLISDHLDGAVYVATPYDNPFPEPGHPSGSLLALYVVAKDPGRGILVKTAGRIEPNPLTGQLVTTFENTPQQPFSRFTL